jgi:uncharacterized protein
MKSALIVYGGYEPHQPKESASFFAEWLRSEGFEVTGSDSLSAFDDGPDLLNFDLIIPMWTMGQLSGVQEKNLCAAVESGVGLAGYHGGMGDAFRSNTTYQFMVGGQFVAHPDGIKDYAVQVTRKDDPITKGLQDFFVKTEQYYMHVDPLNEVLATTTFNPLSAPWVKGCVMPVVWKRHHGAGRVFYSSLGHTVDDFKVPETLEITRRGMLWAAR